MLDWEEEPLPPLVSPNGRRSMKEPVVGEWIVHGFGAGFSSLAARLCRESDSNTTSEVKRYIVVFLTCGTAAELKRTWVGTFVDGPVASGASKRSAVVVSGTR